MCRDIFDPLQNFRKGVVLKLRECICSGSVKLQYCLFEVPHSLSYQPIQRKYMITWFGSISNIFPQVPTITDICSKIFFQLQYSRCTKIISARFYLVSKLFTSVTPFCIFSYHRCFFCLVFFFAAISEWSRKKSSFSFFCVLGSDLPHAPPLHMAVRATWKKKKEDAELFILVITFFNATLTRFCLSYDI